MSQEPITRSVQLPWFRATAFSQVKLFLDMPFPLNVLFLVTSALKSELKQWWRNSVVFATVFRSPLVVFHHSNHHSLNWSSHNSMRFICTFHMCKWSNGIHFSLCEFFRLNPRFVSFSRAFAMVKETFKRIQKKWKGLIWSVKGWSKNKPTCENAVSQTLYGSCTLRVMGSCMSSVSEISLCSYGKLGWPGYQDVGFANKISVTGMKILPYEHSSPSNRDETF